MEKPSPTLDELLPQGRQRISIIQRSILAHEGTPVVDPIEAELDEQVIGSLCEIFDGCKYKNSTDMGEFVSRIIDAGFQLRTKSGVSSILHVLASRLFTAEYIRNMNTRR